MSQGGVTYNVTTNAAEVAKNIGKQADAVVKAMPDLLKAYVVATVKELLLKSYPAKDNDPTTGAGGTQAAIEQGKSNIETEINRAFTTWDKTPIGDLIMAKNEAVLWNLNNPIQWNNPRMRKAWDSRDINFLYEAFKARGWTLPEEQTAYENEPTDELHGKMRDSNTGRILANIRNNRQLRISVRDRQAIENYILTKQKSIGTMAGGWVKALSALGSPVPDNFGGNGFGGASITNQGMSIKASNQLGDYNGMLSKDGLIDQIVRSNAEDLKRKLQAEVDKALSANSTKP